MLIECVFGRCCGAVGTGVTFFLFITLEYEYLYVVPNSRKEKLTRAIIN